MQFGQWPEQQTKPRGRWYLKLRRNDKGPPGIAAGETLLPFSTKQARKRKRRAILQRYCQFGHNGPRRPARRSLADGGRGIRSEPGSARAREGADRRSDPDAR